MSAHETRTFKSGNSEAVRLPQGVGVAVHVAREGDRVVITPARDPAEEKARLLALIVDLKAIGAPPGGVQRRDSFEFPERPGL